MRKLIEKQESTTVVCDNPNCNFEVEQTLELKQYLNINCPKCGEPLLTLDDYLAYVKLIKTVNFINRWFSWITIFYSKNRYSKRQSISVHTHNGYKVS